MSDDKKARARSRYKAGALVRPRGGADAQERYTVVGPVANMEGHYLCVHYLQTSRYYVLEGRSLEPSE